MYGQYSYNSHIRKLVALFGDMFNNISTARQDTSGNLTNQKRVPLAYAPRESFLARLEENPDLTDDRVAISLPRMSFEITGTLTYDALRQLPKNNVCRVTDSNGSPTKIYAPAPYIIPFELNVYSKNQDEALQIVEQIIPYFKPSIRRTYYPIDGETFTDEVIFRLVSVTKEDTYANDFTNNRKIIYTIMFDARINIFARVDTDASVILNSIVNFTTDATKDTNDLTITQSVNPQSATVPTDTHTIDITYNYGFE